MIRYISVTILLILFFIGTNSFNSYKPESPLKGLFTITEKPIIKTENWFNGSFQESYDKYIQQNFYLYDWFIRINNQINFSLFNESSLMGAIIGKDKHVYQDFYINSSKGDDFMGDYYYQEEIKKLSFVKDTLQKLNKNILVIIGPNKADVYPEFLPTGYNIDTNSKNNYKSFIKNISKSSVYYIDFNNYFKSNKQNIDYPIFPQSEVHWSSVAASFACDSILKFLKSNNYPNISQVKKIESNLWYSSPAIDHDITDKFNLLIDPNYKIVPSINIVYDTTNKQKPKYLSISDSFYNHPASLGLFRNCFNKESKDIIQFKTVHSEFDPNYWKERDQINLMSEVNSSDLILLVLTTPNLKDFSWGFIDQLYDFYSKT